LHALGVLIIWHVSELERLELVLGLGEVVNVAEHVASGFLGEIFLAGVLVKQLVVKHLARRLLDRRRV
jgi:hypothetical protein